MYTENKDGNNLTSKTTPIDADSVVIGDSASPSDEPVKRVTFANLKVWIEALTSYFNVSSDTTDDITEGSTNKFATAAEKTKLGYISVTQAVDLDQMETDIAALANGMVYKGNWDASAGSFPGSGAAQTGWFYTVSVGGTVDSVVFNVGDRLIAITDNASTSTYAANWTQLDATDAVTSVDSQTGAIDLGTILYAKTAKTTPVDADTLTITDSAASNVLKKVTWANIKTTLGSTFAALAGSVSQAFSAASIELGHASDTTLSRSAAGKLAVEGVEVPTISSTNTLTNKRITKRVGSTTSSATPTINTDNYDIYRLTAQAVDITSFSTNLSGTPSHGDSLIIEITGTAARAITWGASFEASTVALPTTTVTTAMLMVGFKYNSATSKWRCVASA